jgi:hypothetical protein
MSCHKGYLEPFDCGTERGCLGCLKHPVPRYRPQQPSPTGEGKEARPETEGEVCQECESIMLARHEAEKARLKEQLCDEQAETFMAWWREAEAIGENIHLHQANSALRLRVEELEERPLACCCVALLERAEAAERRAEEVERSRNALFAEGSRQEERAIAAEVRAAELERQAVELAIPVEALLLAEDQGAMAGRERLLSPDLTRTMRDACAALRAALHPENTP